MGLKAKTHKGHLRVRQKELDLKRKPHQHETREADDLVDAEGYVCLPELQTISAEVEAELAAFRGDKTSVVERLEAAIDKRSDLDPTVVQVYTAVGKILAAYRSGKVPKAFKMIPALEQWEAVLQLTSPSAWTPQAMCEAVSVFVSNMTPPQAQKFLQSYFLPALRIDIREHGKLNFHYYAALKKAIYKPAAWFKGVIFPMCEDKNTTLREAAVLGSAVMKVSMPMAHASAALLRLSTLPYTGPASFVIKSLLAKKLALPKRVVSGLQQFFVRARTEERHLPLLWHQLLLTFVQLYAKHLDVPQRAQLREILQVQRHALVSPEVERLLDTSLELA